MTRKGKHKNKVDVTVTYGEWQFHGTLPASAIRKFLKTTMVIFLLAVMMLPSQQHTLVPLLHHWIGSSFELTV